LPGVPLGSFPGVTYDEATVPLQAGDVLVFCTDGIFEATSPIRWHASCNFVQPDSSLRGRKHVAFDRNAIARVLAARKTAAPPEHSQAILDAFITASEDVGVDLDPRVMYGRQCLVCGDIINSGAYRSGASDLTSAAERAVAPLERLAPELQAAGDALRQAELELRETASDLRAFLASLEAEPGRLEEVEAELESLADLRRRHRAQTYIELLERGAAARRELAALADGHDPVRAAEAALERAQSEVDTIHADLRKARRRAAEPFARAVAAELKGIGLGDGEFQVVLTERDPGATGADEVAFLIRPNPGLPFGPVAETASGGELSRIALAIAAVAGGETMVFDEIDAGIGGTTAHAVAETLRRLAERAQVVTITHLPQIASVAERHFRVEKVPGDPTHTQIEQLGDLERRNEVERMLGGAEFLASLDR